MKTLTACALAIVLGCTLGPRLSATTAPDLEQGLELVAKTLVEGLATQDVRKIAVIEFTDLAGYRSTLGPFVAEELTTQLLTVKPGAFDVVERQQLAKVLAEQSLSSSALFDAETIASVGKVLGIQAIITGTTADLGDDVKIHARCISVATAKVFAAAATRVPKLGTVDTLMRQGAAPGPGGSGGKVSSRNRQGQASDVFFQNGFLRLTVSSASISGDGGSVTLGLVAEILTPADRFVGLEVLPLYMVSTKDCLATLVDDQGGEYSLDRLAGLAYFPFTTSLEPGYFTLMPGKSSTTITLRFVRRGGDEESAPTFVSLGLSLLQLAEGKVSRFSAGLSNVQLQTAE